MPTVVLACPYPVAWYRHFPGTSAGDELVCGRWRFLINDWHSPCDAMVVFDDLPELVTPRCPRERVLHLGTEPLIVRRYPQAFTDQFALCLSADPDLQHPHRVVSHPALPWFLGWNPDHGDAPGSLTWQQMHDLFDEPRTKTISVISSNKAFTEEHRRRLDFALKLKDRLKDKIDFYGRGFRDMSDKTEALRGYRFHVALENTRQRDYFTEKLSDAFIAGAFPLYHGCPNIGDSFPDDALLPINIDDMDGSVRAIEAAIEGNLDQQRRHAMRAARDLVMGEYNLPNVIVRMLDRIEAGEFGAIAPVRELATQLIPFRSREFRKKYARPPLGERLARPFAKLRTSIRKRIGR